MPGLSRDEALRRLRELADDGDFEEAHQEADGILVRLIDDDEIRAAYEKIGKWYA